MKNFQYLIVGGGMAGDAAVRGIRESDSQSTIGMIGQEPDPPYNRPPLSKGLWKGKSIDRIWRGTEKRDVEMILGRKVVNLDAGQKIVTDDQGTEYGFEKLLLATGGTPHRFKNSSERVVYYRTVRDYQRLRALADEKQHFIVIGSGFIGSEIAAALRMNGKDVTMLFPEGGLCERLFPTDLSQFLNQYYQEKGVRVVTNTWIDSVVDDGEELVVRDREGHEWRADAVVAGLGIRPNIELAEQAGLQVDNGVVVDSTLRTTHPDIFAAGDIANFPTNAVFLRTRSEHEENANLSGMVAGQAMSGRPNEYGTLPMAYSDLFELGYESVGVLNPKLQVLADWQEPFQKGVLYYVDAGRVSGVLTMGMFGKMPLARELIAETGPFKPEDLRGSISFD